MTPSNILEALETSVTPWATVVGSVFGVLLVLTPATAALVLLGKWLHWVGVALSVTVLLGTLYTVIEVVGAIQLREEADVTVFASSVKYLIGIKVAELILFTCSLVVLYVFLFGH